VIHAPDEAMERVAKARRARGLDVPYGKHWERLKRRMKKKRRDRIRPGRLLASGTVKDCKRASPPLDLVLRAAERPELVA
jgi:hypothetical protein